MIYRENIKNGDRISQLGFGLMRLPMIEKEILALMECAVSEGINYFDTAYIYPGSEVALGNAVTTLGFRDRIFIATKLPPMLVRRAGDFDRIFNAQLGRLNTDRIDYYLVHMLTNLSGFERILGLGFDQWAAQKKADGAIKNIGFSFHGSAPQFRAIVDAYPWDFTMIQYNYLDEHQQAGTDGLHYAASKGLPVMIMEPLRGGKLVRKLPLEAATAFTKADPNKSFADWGLQWVLDHPEVTTVLSGMNSLEMLRENIRLASQFKAGTLTQREHSVYREVVRAFANTGGIPCTGCNYCMPCPRGVDIPLCFTIYNDRAVEGRLKSMYHYAVRNRMDASLCVDCGKCESHCPQQINIRRELKNVQKAMAGGLWRLPHIALKKIIRQ